MAAIGRNTRVTAVQIILRGIMHPTLAAKVLIKPIDSLNGGR